MRRDWRSGLSRRIRRRIDSSSSRTMKSRRRDGKSKNNKMEEKSMEWDV